MSKKKYIRRILLRGFFLKFVILGRVFPRSWLLAYGSALGALAGKIARRERERAIAQLKKAFPSKTDEEIAAVVSEMFRNIGKNFTELFWLPRLNKRNLGKYVRFEGIEKLNKWKANGKPLLIITGHIGNWEMMAAACALAGYPSTVIARRQSDPWINDKIARFRARWGIETVWREDSTSGRKILSALKNGSALAMLMDQDTRIDSVFVDFFGQKAYTPSGPAALSLRAECYAAVAYIHRESNNKHVVRFNFINQAEATGNREEDILKRTQQFTAAIESAIREKPEQWVWFHKRWKTKIENKK